MPAVTLRITTPTRYRSIHTSRSLRGTRTRGVAGRAVGAGVEAIAMRELVERDYGEQAASEHRGASYALATFARPYGRSWQLRPREPAQGIDPVYVGRAYNTQREWLKSRGKNRSNSASIGGAGSLFAGGRLSIIAEVKMSRFFCEKLLFFTDFRTTGGEPGPDHWPPGDRG